MLATLARVFGDLSLAEEAVQEAFVVALRSWPQQGVPENPGAWITTIARRRAIDLVRREVARSAKEEVAGRVASGNEPPEVHPVPDDQLRLIFTCCHPALAAEAQVALTLRLGCGLQTTEIARAFLVAAPTVAQRLVRAKRKIRDAGIAFRVPPAHLLPERLPPVMGCIYLVFTEGYAASGDDLVRADLCEEASRLARLLVTLMPDEPEAHGLLALILLHDSRRATRTDETGGLVLLADQDRRRGDRPDEAASAYREALALVGTAAERAFLERRLAEVASPAPPVS